MSHINVHLSADIKIFDLSKSDENAVGVGFDFESLDELEIGENVKWYNKKDGQLTGKIIEIQNKKAIIKVDDGRKMKVILKKLKLNSNPRIQGESEGSEGSEESEESDDTIKVGSKVKWNRTIKGELLEETGEIVKISEKIYQICCKKNKKNFFVSKNEESLQLIK